MVKSHSKIQKPKPVSDLVTERLREDILRGEFELGERISEGQLSEHYGVTKAPIRAAYMRLQAEGLLDVRPQAGTFVFMPSAEEVRALCELRAALELEALELAVQRSFKALCKTLTGICDEMEHALSRADLDVYQKLDTDLHLAIVEHADSPMLLLAYQSGVSGRFEALRSRFSRAKDHQVASSTEHIILRDKIASKDIHGARAHLREHIDNTRIYFSRLIDKD